jgi:hypothetical protein
MNIHSIDLYIFPLEEMRCGYGIQQGNILPSLSDIPGRVVRGGLANWALRNNACASNTNQIFKDVFEPNGAAKISFPFCAWRGYRRVPLSLFEVKGGGRNPRTALVEIRQAVYAENQLDPANIIQVQGPVDFLCRELWPAQLDVTMKPVLDSLIHGENEIVPDVGMMIELRNRHNQDTRRVGEEGLFAEECLPPANPAKMDRREDNYYVGTLRYEEDSQISNLFEKLATPRFRLVDFNRNRMMAAAYGEPDPPHDIFLGHHRIRCLIYGVDRGVCSLDPANLTKPAASKFTLTFTSDFAPIKSHGAVYPLTVEMLKENGLPLFERLRVFCGRGAAYGFDVQNNKVAIPAATITAGSCAWLKKDSFSDEEKKTILEKSLLGMGRQTKDGFGRFEIDWGIHKVRGEEVTP